VLPALIRFRHRVVERRWVGIGKWDQPTIVISFAVVMLPVFFVLWMTGNLPGDWRMALMAVAWPFLVLLLWFGLTVPKEST
jgi:hypothetical protein